jgi:hypothetical protein
VQALSLPFDLTPEEEFVLTVRTSIAVTVVAIARYHDGKRVRTVPLKITPTVDRAQYEESVRIGSGKLLTVTATSETTGIKRGQVYVELFLQSPAIPLVVQLAAGYVYDGHALGGGEFVEAGPGGGEGFIRTVTGTDPAAGVEVSEAVPTNAVWDLLSFGYVFVASADAANRSPQIVVDDGTTANRRWGMSVGAVITANQTRTVLYVRGYSNSSIAPLQFTDTDALMIAEKLPPLGILSEGYRIRTVTGSIQAADNMAAPIFQVEEWLVL